MTKKNILQQLKRFLLELGFSLPVTYVTKKLTFKLSCCIKESGKNNFMYADKYFFLFINVFFVNISLNKLKV